MNKHFSFPSIEQFKNVYRKVQDKAQFVGLDDNSDPIFDRSIKLPTLSFKGTVKLHGTNGAIILTKDSFYCQSRERICTLDNDNAGFAKFIYGLPNESFDILRSNLKNEKVAIYVEWAGKGIQDNVAISKIDKSVFVLAARVIDDNDEKAEWLDISSWKLPEKFYNINNFKSFEVKIDFESPNEAVEKINKWVLEVEQECPVAKELGVSGVGEGIVFWPMDEDYSDSKFIFKCKGEKHSKSKEPKLATIDPAKLESDQAFINFALDEGRLEQGYKWLAENGKSQDVKSTGDFIKWVVGDVNKECYLEMAAKNITEKDLGKLLVSPARQWYVKRQNTIK